MDMDKEIIEVPDIVTTEDADTLEHSHTLPTSDALTMDMDKATIEVPDKVTTEDADTLPTSDTLTRLNALARQDAMQRQSEGDTMEVPRLSDELVTPDGAAIYAHVSKPRNRESMTPSTIQVPESRTAHVRFSDVRVEHSFSVPDSVTSWQDSSFNDSFRNTLADYDGELMRYKSKTGADNCDFTDILNKEDDGTRLGMFKNMMTSTERLLQSDTGEKFAIKAVLGILVILALVVVLYVLFVYCFGYPHVAAGVIVAIATIPATVGLILSTHCRCFVSLVFPCFLTGSGRSVLLSVVLSLLLTHPVINIWHNMEETGNSMACMADIASNHSRILQPYIATSLPELSDYLDRQQSALARLGHDINGTFQDVRVVLDTMDQGNASNNNTISAIRKACIEQIVRIEEECKRRCINDACRNICSTFDRNKESCSSLEHMDTFLTEAAWNARYEIDRAVELFALEFKASNASMTESPQNTQNEVKVDIENITDTIETCLGVGTKLLSLSIAMMIFTCIWYIHKYLCNDAFNNVYITRSFQYKEERYDGLEKGTILPLTTAEKEAYVHTSSWKLIPPELSHCTADLILIFLLLILFVFVVAVDCSLWYILDDVRSHVRVDVNIGNASIGPIAGDVNASVIGAGIIAEFYTIVTKSLNSDRENVTIIEIEPCLPHPHQPNTHTFIAIGVLYLTTICCVFLQAYAYRAIRKICACFYQRQETERLNYLRNSIHNNRVNLKEFLPTQIVSNHKEKMMRRQLRVSTYLVDRCPQLTRLIVSCNAIEPVMCMGCLGNQGNRNSIRVNTCCGHINEIECDAAFCDKCWVLLRYKCPLCQPNEYENVN